MQPSPLGEGAQASVTTRKKSSDSSGTTEARADMDTHILRVEVQAIGVAYQQVETAIQAGLSAALGGNLVNVQITDASTMPFKGWPLAPGVWTCTQGGCGKRAKWGPGPDDALGVGYCVEHPPPFESLGVDAEGNEVEEKPLPPVTAAAMEWTGEEDDRVFLDSARKLYRDPDNGEVCFAFGKCAGRAVLEDQETYRYGQWMSMEDFPEDTKKILRELLYKRKGHG